jgi:HEAT repeat protein
MMAMKNSTISWVRIAMVSYFAVLLILAFLFLRASGYLGIMPKSYWMAKLRSTNSSDRAQASYELCKLGPKAKSLVPELILMLSDQNANVRRASAGVLESIGPDASEAVDQLIVLLHDPDVSVRLQAASALGSIGTEAKKAVPALKESLNDSTEFQGESVSSVASTALIRIDPAAAKDFHFEQAK